MLTKLTSSLLVLCLLTTCRYKDNTNLNLKSAKKRLCKDWVLKSAVSLDGNFDALASISGCAVKELTIYENDLGFIVLKLPINDGIGLSLERNKTELRSGGKMIFKITKLTNSELWLEGEPLLCRCETQWINDIKLKYKYNAR